MLIKKFCFLILLVCQNIFAQQNLVINPSFEEVNGQLKCYLYGNEKFPIVGWSSASEGSIDAFSTNLPLTCIMHPFNDSFAGQKPRSGSNYLGISNLYNDKEDYREYLRGNLSQPLEVGALYKIEFYVCLSNFATAATNNIGLTFINNKVSVFPNVGPIPLKPDVNYSGKPITERNKWTLLSFEFVPTKPNLNAFIIGNFFDSSETKFQILSERLPIEAYLLIDDVKIYKEDIVFDVPTEICAGENVILPTTSKNGIKGNWDSEFDPYNTKKYMFTSNSTDLKVQVDLDITVHQDVNFELLRYCENLEFFVEPKFENTNHSNINSYSWKINNALIIDNSSKFNLSKYKGLQKGKNTLELTVTNKNGCSKTQKMYFYAENLCKVQKEVSPNNDNINDFLDLESFGDIDLKIFNRFGKVVYQKENYISEWKGQSNDDVKLPNGNYFYQVDTKIGEQISGWIQLIN